MDESELDVGAISCSNLVFAYLRQHATAEHQGSCWWLLREWHTYWYVLETKESMGYRTWCLLSGLVL